MKHLKSIISFVLILSVLCIPTGCSKKEKTPQDSIINYHITYEPETLDPQIADDDVSDMIILNIYEGLVRLNGNDDIIGGAAETWDISSDNKTYTFHLRNGLRWSNGEELTSSDFVYGFQRSVSKQTNSPTAKTLFSIKNAEQINSGSASVESLGVTSPDKNTVVIELEYPDSEILTTLTTPPAMPCNKKFFENSVGQYGRTDDKILSNGAYCINEGKWASGENIFLSKNEYYKGQNKPVPAGVKLNILQETPDVCQSIIDGDTDCGAIKNSDLSKAQNEKLNLTAFDDTIHGISINSENDVLKNINIRHALLSAIDKNKLLKNLDDDCEPADELIPDSAEIEDNSYRKLAGHVGYAVDEDPSSLLNRGLAESDLTSLPNLTILCSDDENTQTVVSNLIETWNTLTGAYFNKKPMSAGELGSRIKSGSYQIAITTLKISGTTPLGTLEAFTSTADNNPGAYHSDEYDCMINDLRKSLTKESAEKVKEAESMIINSSVFYPLYTQKRYYASAKNVRNVIFHPYGGDIDFMTAVKKEQS